MNSARGRLLVREVRIEEKICVFCHFFHGYTATKRGQCSDMSASNSISSALTKYSNLLVRFNFYNGVLCFVQRC